MNTRIPELYKFLNQKDVHFWIEGSVQIKPLSYYRSMEGEDWIRDQEENQSRFVTDDLYIGSSDFGHGKILADRLEKTGFFIVPPGTHNVRLIGMQLANVANDVYVLCFAQGPLGSAKEAMCQTAPIEYRYDACLHFPKPRELLKRIFDKGRVNGRPIQELFSRWDYGAVIYTKRPSKIEEEDPVHFTAYHKPARFSTQQEFRVVLAPREPITDVLTIEFQPRPRLIRQLF